MSWTKQLMIKINEPMEFIEIGSPEHTPESESFQYAILAKVYANDITAFSWACGDKVDEPKIKKICETITNGVLELWENDQETHQEEVRKFKTII